MTIRALIPQELFDGFAFFEATAVLVEDGVVVGLAPASSLGRDVVREEVEGLLAPGFVDVQVNGGGGVLLNDDPSVDAMAAIAAAHRRFGTTALLPTLITDERSKAAAAMGAAREAISKRAPGVIGVHLEGPFLNPERQGVHNIRFMRAPDANDVSALTAPGAGAVVSTIAPECTPPGFVRALTDAGVRVSAGHTTATPAWLAEARAEGLSGYTHLFNAMPPLVGREPGPVGAALSERDTFCGLIADLHHVAPAALMAAIAAKGFDRAMLVTDAMPTVGSEGTEFVLQGRRITLEDGRLTAEDGTLAGSHLDMATAVRNAVRALGVPRGDALAMASRTPAAWLGLGGSIGRIAPGYRADFVSLDKDFVALSTWIGGVRRDG